MSDQDKPKRFPRTPAEFAVYCMDKAEQSRKLAALARAEGDYKTAAQCEETANKALHHMDNVRTDWDPRNPGPAATVSDWRALLLDMAKGWEETAALADEECCPELAEKYRNEAKEIRERLALDDT